eukprot:1942208-Rhodomonas_salina.2
MCGTALAYAAMRCLVLSPNGLSRGPSPTHQRHVLVPDPLVPDPPTQTTLANTPIHGFGGTELAYATTGCLGICCYASAMGCAVLSSRMLLQVRAPSALRLPVESLDQ